MKESQFPPVLELKSFRFWHGYDNAKSSDDIDDPLWILFGLLLGSCQHSKIHVVFDLKKEISEKIKPVYQTSMISTLRQLHAYVISLLLWPQ